MSAPGAIIPGLSCGPKWVRSNPELIGLNVFVNTIIAIVFFGTIGFLYWKIRARRRAGVATVAEELGLEYADHGDTIVPVPSYLRLANVAQKEAQIASANLTEARIAALAARLPTSIPPGIHLWMLPVPGHG